MNAGRRAPARSALVVPAVAGSRLDRAPLRGADQIVIDLEDAVAPDHKASARSAAVAALGAPGWQDVDVAVRVNGWESADTWRDVVEVLGGAAGRVTTLVLAKTENVDHIVALDLLVTQLERTFGLEPGGVRLAALVESAAGLLAAPAVAAASQRLAALVLGPLDLAGDLGVTSDDDGGEPLPVSWREDALRRLVLAGRAAGVGVLDGPSFAIDDMAAVSRAALRARSCGCEGCWAVHPRQLEPVHAAFTPSDTELARARAVVEAVQGAGVARLNGTMVDAASVRAARTVLARAPNT